MIKTVTYQSKMNFSQHHLNEAKKFIFNYYPANKPFSITSVPSSIIGQLMKLWDDGIEYMGKIIAIDETMENFTIICQKSNSKHLVLNTQTGIYYDGVREAYQYSGSKFSEHYFWRMITGKNKNKTNFEIV